MSQAPAPARPVPGFARVPGLAVIGNVLCGTLCVIFQIEPGVVISQDGVVASMRGVNRKLPSGYGINLNLRQETTFEQFLWASHTELKVAVVQRLEGGKCDGAAACYDPQWDVMRITPHYHDTYIVHELLHKLGMGHSGSTRSLMFWNEGERPIRDLYLLPEEVKALVDAYR